MKRQEKKRNRKCSKDKKEGWSHDERHTTRNPRKSLGKEEEKNAI